MRPIVLALFLSLSFVSLAHADAIPGDSACHRWEHWEGAHSGRCTFGPRCSVSAPGATHESGALALVGIALMAITRASSRRSR